MKIFLVIVGVVTGSGPCRDSDMVLTAGCMRVARLLADISSVERLEDFMVPLGVKEPQSIPVRFPDSSDLNPVVLTPVDGVLMSSLVQQWLAADSDGEKDRLKLQLGDLATRSSQGFVKAVIQRHLGWLRESVHDGMTQGAHESLGKSLVEVARSREILKETNLDLAMEKSEFEEWKKTSKAGTYAPLLKEMERYRARADASGSLPNIAIDASLRDVFDKLLAEDRIDAVIQLLANLQKAGMNASSVWALCKRAHKELHSKYVIEADLWLSRISGLEDLVVALIRQISEFELLIAAKQTRLDKLLTMTL